jgi:hypothetical protein
LEQKSAVVAENIYNTPPPYPPGTQQHTREVLSATNHIDTIKTNTRQVHTGHSFLPSRCPRIAVAYERHEITQLILIAKAVHMIIKFWLRAVHFAVGVCS